MLIIICKTDHIHTSNHIAWIDIIDAIYQSPTADSFAIEINNGIIIISRATLGDSIWFEKVVQQYCRGSIFIFFQYYTIWKVTIASNWYYFQALLDICTIKRMLNIWAGVNSILIQFNKIISISWYFQKLLWPFFFSFKDPVKLIYAAILQIVQF